MKQRVNLITLGVGNLARARRFYEAIGWATGADPGDVELANHRRADRP